jgi:hypothetical protein
MLHSNQEESLTSSFRGFHNIHAHVMVFVQNEMENVQQHWKLPFIIGTEEFARDSECGLAGIKKWFLVPFQEFLFLVQHLNSILLMGVAHMSQLLGLLMYECYGAICGRFYICRCVFTLRNSRK